MNKEKVTYILGAGASIGTYPLVKPTPLWNNLGLAELMINEGERLTRDFGTDKIIGATAFNIGEGMKKVGKYGIEFGNVDTYAKYLYHHKDKTRKELDNLKLALTYYFVKTLICNRHALKEKRYFNFITSLITQEHIFPKHVNMLSWNYDFLFEEASKIFSVDQFTSKTIIHLNETAGKYVRISDTGKKTFVNIYDQLLGEREKKISERELLLLFQNEYVSEPNLLTFAWEKNSVARNIFPNRVEDIRSFAKDTEILVVIGYSFPFFNREVDNSILKEMKPTLRKIYYQDPKIDGKFLVKRYGLGNDEYDSEDNKIILRPKVEIEHIADIEQFYIPIEI